MTSTKLSGQVAIPRLENGDKLNRFEFEHRYSAIPDLKKFVQDLASRK